MANLYKDFQSSTLMSFGKSFARLNGQPLDKSAIWYSKAEADAYALTGSAYVGQPVAVIDESAGKTTLYVVGNAGTLEQVGSLPDGMSLELHGDKIQLKGFDEAAENAQLRKNKDGELEWFVPSTETVDGLQSTVGTLKTDVENAQKAIDDLETLVGTETVEAQIDTKIAELDLGNTYEAKGAAATAKSEIESVIGEVAENKTIVEMISDAQTAATYDDTELSNRVKAIEDDHLAGADKTELEDKIADAVASEKERAEGVESGLRSDVDVIKGDYLKAADKTALQDQINLIMNNPDTEGVINSLSEFTQYIAEHGEVAEGFRKDIDANKKAIEDHEAAAALAYETKNDAAGKLTEAKGYADDLHAAAMEAVGKKADAVNGKSLVDDTLITKLEGVEEGAQANKIESVDEAQFKLEGKHLTLLDIAIDKVTGLSQALENKAGKNTTLAGYGITDAYTKTETEERIQEVLDGLSDTSETAASVAQALEAYKTSNDQRITDLEGVVGGKVEAEDGKSLIANDLIAKVEGMEASAQVNKIDGVSNEFTINADGKILSINLIEMEKINGLSDALNDKVSAVDGKGLSTNDLTDELLEKLNASQANVLEGVQINGADVTITEKKVNIKSTDIVKASAEVTVAEDGTLGVGQINVDKLVQTAGTWLILNGGTAAD